MKYRLINKKNLKLIKFNSFYFITMGAGESKSSKKKNTKNPVQQNWEPVSQTQTYNIVRNKSDGRQAQEYLYALDNRHDPSGQAYIFQRRSKTTFPIVRAFDHQWQTKGSGMIPTNNFRVVTERLLHRLTNCPQLSFDQSLYVLDKALEGYNFLYHSIGAFDINSNMIGFTNEGEARVWLNQNFGKNYPFHEKRTLQATRIDEYQKYETDYVPLEEIEMVRNIVNVIQDRCQEGQFPGEFREKIRQNIGFNEARKMLKEQFSNPQRVVIKRIDFLTNLVRSKITKNISQGMRQTNNTYETPFPVKNTSSVLQNNQHQINRSQYHSFFVPQSQAEKNAYSFSCQKEINV